MQRRRLKKTDFATPEAIAAETEANRVAAAYLELQARAHIDSGNIFLAVFNTTLFLFVALPSFYALTTEPQERTHSPTAELFMRLGCASFCAHILLNLFRQSHFVQRLLLGRFEFADYKHLPAKELAIYKKNLRHEIRSLWF